MKRFLLLLFSALSLTAVAQQKKVAVYVTGQQTGINKVLGDQLVAAFAKSGTYIAIERTSSFLAELGKEQTYQRTGAVDDNELSRLGKQFGVQLVCVADVSDVFGEKYVSTRLIDVESAEVINTANAGSKLDSMQELLRVADLLAKELTDKTVQEKTAEAAIRLQNEAGNEIKIKKTLELGYIQVGNLYATISYSRVPWKDARSIAAECQIGGMMGWRVPTVTEYDLIARGFKRYKSEIYLYPNIKLDIEQLDCSGHDGVGFWTSKGQLVPEGYANRDNYLMLVHDVE